VACFPQNYFSLNKLDPNPLHINFDGITNIDSCYAVLETPDDILLYDFSETPSNSDL
jgi:hypothetical protein